jgi:DNA-binding HxlR family transcriptional regulator
MHGSKADILDVLMGSYSIHILELLKDGPKRFKDLKQLTKSDATLSTRISKMREFGLIDVVSIMIKKKYVNCYRLTSKGIRVLKALKSK